MPKTQVFNSYLAQAIEVNSEEAVDADKVRVIANTLRLLAR